MPTHFRGTKVTKKTRELILGGVMLAIGAFYLFMTFQIPRKGTIDATFIPFILSGTLFLLGFLQLGGTLFGKKKDISAQSQQPTKKKDKVDSKTVIETIFIIIVYLAFLGRVGFVIMSAIYLFAQFIVLTPLSKKKNYLLYAITAIVSSVSIYLIFRYVFNLMLPEGLLK
jgi:putative tricarboxylic transport membrane protein